MATEKQRREAARRKLERQIERREELERQRKNRMAWMWGVAGLLVVALIIFLVVVNSSDSDGKDNQAGGPGACDYQTDPTSDLAVGLPPTDDVPKKGTVTLDVTTSAGAMVFSLDRASAPCAVNSFEYLASQGFFDGSPCHRLTTEEAGFGVLQCGDPTGQGTGGPGYQFANEYPTDQYQPDDPKLQQPVIYPRGTLAMANAGPGTNGSQFFLVYKDSTLPPNYTVFGTIDQTGLATLDKIAAAGTKDGGEDGAPKLDVTIKQLQLD